MGPLIIWGGIIAGLSVGIAVLLAILEIPGWIDDRLATRDERTEARRNAQRASVHRFEVPMRGSIAAPGRARI